MRCAKIVTHPSLRSRTRHILSPTTTTAPPNVAHRPMAALSDTEGEEEGEGAPSSPQASLAFPSGAAPRCLGPLSDPGTRPLSATDLGARIHQNLSLPSSR
ncbi:uncharacterized protein SCHCODRAFT_01108244 [Schizophyllum commune H4-8]|nr:uncharacterized protein SCHCODRAFT_01108244 [Schizophyllum commune H4-8]KAI5886253.1 hypothetical protein SCHCODRAFT_01108244 [Schizophyllum commune H4-8]